jgi:hypothetical protein
MIHVLGLGLCCAHRSAQMLALIHAADLVAGGKRLLDELEIEDGKRLPLTSMEEFALRIRERATKGHVCVLADGDPCSTASARACCASSPRTNSLSTPMSRHCRPPAPASGCPGTIVEIALSLHGRKGSRLALFPP